MDVQENWFAVVGVLVAGVALSSACLQWWRRTRELSFQRQLGRRTWFQTQRRRRRWRNQGLSWKPKD